MKQNPGSSAESSEAALHAIDLWRAIVRRRRFLALSVLAALVVGAIATAVTTREYRATATMQIERQSPEIFSIKDGLGDAGGRFQDFYETQFQILTSRAVLTRVVNRVGLTTREEYRSRKASPIRRAIGWIRGAGSVPNTEDERRERAVEFLARRASARPAGKSHIVQVSVTDADPVLARDLANALVEAFEQFNLDARYATTSKANEFLTKQVIQVQSEIAAMERQLQKLGVSKDILVARDDSYDIAAQALAALNARFVEAKTRLASSEARVRSLTEGDPGSLPEVVDHPLVKQLRKQHADAVQSNQRISPRFGEDWPTRRELREEIEIVERRLPEVVAQVASEVLDAATAARDRVRNEVGYLAVQVEEHKVEAQRVSREAIEYASIKAEIDSRRRFLNELVGRQSETQLTDRLRDARASNVRIVDAAMVPVRPARPNVTINMFLSLLIGATIGVGLALAVDRLDNTVKSGAHVRDLTDLPVLGEISKFTPGAAVASEYDPVDVACYLAPASPFSESFKNLRTNILLTSPERPPRHIAITSAEPGDGKSTVSLNLAVALAQMGRSVLLVDADLRRPRIHEMLRIDNSVGLSTFLTGSAEFDDIVRETPISGLSVISGGPVPPMPSELLDAPRLGALLGVIDEGSEFDHVVFDSAPVLHVSDSVILSTRVDATAIVVRANKSTRESLAQGVARLHHARARVVGVIVNDTEEAIAYSYYVPPGNGRKRSRHAGRSKSIGAKGRLVG